jgi:hypothetical protein
VYDTGKNAGCSLQLLIGVQRKKSIHNNQTARASMKRGNTHSLVVIAGEIDYLPARGANVNGRGRALLLDGLRFFRPLSCAQSIELFLRSLHQYSALHALLSTHFEVHFSLPSLAYPRVFDARLDIFAGCCLAVTLSTYFTESGRGDENRIFTHTWHVSPLRMRLRRR